MFGKINLENFDGMTKMPQKAATAWAGAFGEPLAGASFKPLLYLGDQLVNGTNYCFIAEETLATRCPIRHVVKLVIFGDDDEYKLLDDSITEIA